MDLVKLLSRVLHTADSGAGDAADAAPAKLRDARPSALYSISYIIWRLHHTQPLLHHEVQHTYAEQLVDQLWQGCHILQRATRILGTVALRLLCVRHPLGWTLPQEVVCMLMYGILQSRQVPAWRAFFSGVGDLQQWVPVVKEQVATGSCSSWWVRLPPDARPKEPAARVTWVYLHGGAFVAGDALMYTGVYAYWMYHLAKQGVECSILSVEYPLAPEHPFPAAVHASAGVITWVLEGCGGTQQQEQQDYILGGDSAGGNLALAGLCLLRQQGRLARPPLALTLISPAVDISDASVFGAREPVASHFSTGREEEGRGQGPDAAAAAVAAGPGGQGVGAAGQECPANGATAQQGRAARRGSSKQQPEQPQQRRQQQASAEAEEGADGGEQHCTMHARHTPGGAVRPLQLLQGLAAEALTACRVHLSRAAADAQMASGWFDYIPADSFADELHCYLRDPTLLADPLVSPTYMPDLSGLCSRGMLLVAGGAELMRPDIAAFAAKARAAGVPGVVLHEEPAEPHAFPVVAMPHLMRKGLVVPRFVADVALERAVGASRDGGGGSSDGAGADAAAAGGGA